MKKINYYVTLVITMVLMVASMAYAQSQSDLTRVTASGKIAPKPGQSALITHPSFAAPKAGLLRVPAMRPADAPARIAGMNGNFYGVVSFYGDFENYYQGFMGRMDVNNGAVSKDFFGYQYLWNSSNYGWLMTGTVRNGWMYIPYLDENMVTREIGLKWTRTNLATGECEDAFTFSFERQPEALVYAMAYNPSDDCFYGISLNMVNMYSGSLVRVKGETGAMSVVGPINSPNGQFISGLTYNSLEDKLIGIRVNSDGIGEVISISTEDATITIEGETDEYAVPFYVNEMGPVSQPITFSPRDNAYIALVRDPQDGHHVAYSIDAETFEPEYLSAFDSYYESIPIMVCTDLQAHSSAPAASVIDAIEFDGLAKQGTATITLPEVTYGGRNITRNMTLAVYVDDTLIETRPDCAAGSQQVVNLDIAEDGLYNLAVYTYFKETELSPVAERVFCVGHDNPKAPTNVKVDGLHLTWDAPGAKGQHEGYVETAALTYDVYANGQKLNDADITGTSYDMPLPDALTHYVIGVVAKANGKESLPGESEGFLYGDAMQLPVSLRPTADQAKLFHIVDGNNDGRTWYYDAANQSFNFEVSLWGQVFDIQNKDWIFLPVTNFDDNDILYDFEYWVVDRNSMAETGVVKTYIGKDCTPEAMTTLLQTEENLQTINNAMGGFIATKRSTTFALPEGVGTYYIGVCYESDLNQFNLSMDRFKITKSKRSSAAPDLAQNVEIVPGAKGALEATVNWTMPGKTTVGDMLDADTDITMTVKTGAESKQVAGKPGAACTTTVACKQGNNTFTLTASNEAGSGFDLEIEKYIGMDKPKAITAIKSVTSEDNGTITLSWEAPTEGINGGYIDTENMTYRIYRSTSIYYNLVGETSETTFDYCPIAGEMDMFTVGAVAVVDNQQSPYGMFVQDMLGPAHKAPIYETFYTDERSFEYAPWKNTTTDEFDGTTWEILSSLEPFGINNNPAEVALVCFSDGLAGYGQLIVPKVDTRGYEKSFLGLTFYNYNDCADVEILGRRYGAEEIVSLGNLDRTGLENNAWVTYSFELPEGYADCPWIQLFLKVHTNGKANSVFAIDELSISNPTNFDMRVKKFVGPDQSPVGTAGRFKATVENVGLRRCEGAVKFTLYCDGEAMESKTSEKMTLMPRVKNEAQAIFESDPSYIGHEVKVVAEIISDSDMNTNNNKAEASWVISHTSEPIVADLTGEWNEDHNKVNLNWSQPDLKYGGVEGFESYPEFEYGEKIGPWTNIDGDQAAPFAIQQLIGNWPDYWEPKAWQVINAEALGVNQDPRLGAHSGKQYLLAMSCGYNEEAGEEPIQSADWLISPEVVGGTTVSFWYGTISSDYTEYLEVYYSTTDNKPESFKKIRNFSKSGIDTWEYVSFDLPNTAKYFAIKYVSWGAWGAMIDDIVYTPRNVLKWALEHYNVYRDDELVAEKVLGTSWTDDNIGDNNAVYHVTTVATLTDMTKECPRSNRVKMWSTGVDEISALTGVFGTKGVIKAQGYEGKTISVYSADGSHLLNSKVESADASIPMQAGIYLVKIDNAICKVLVK